jgi:hypothetical protein
MASGRSADAGLRRVFVQVDFGGLRDNLTVIVMAAGSANVMRALQLATVRTFMRVRGDQ